MNYPRYPKYKDSGMDWLGEVPEGWSILRLKNVSRLIGGGTPSKENLAYWNGGQVLWVSPKDMTSRVISDAEDRITEQAVLESTTNFVEKHMPLLVVRSGILKHTIPVAMAGCRLTINQDMKAFVFTSCVLPSFFTYWVEGNNDALLLAWRQIGATVESIDVPKMMESWFPIPSLNEQKLIVAYLDIEVGKIDALIAEQEKLISLLQEKRQAVISHAVTKGLNPDAPMKDSGVEWLGKVPAGWDIMLLKRVWTYYEYGISDSISGDGPIRVITMAHIADGRVVPPDLGSISDVPQELLLHDGDLLFNRTNSLEHVGKTGIYQSDAPIPTTFASYLVRLTPNSFCNAEYLNYLLNSDEMRAIARQTAIPSINQANLTPSRYGAVMIALPTLAEQKQVVGYLDGQVKETNSLIAEAENMVELLRERRTALISAAVTGKIDARDGAKHDTIRPATTAPNIYFRRTVFAAEIIDQLCEQPGFGHVFFQKCLYVAQYHLRISDFGENYFRQVAGPHDNRLMYSLDSQLRDNQWFKAEKQGGKYSYSRLGKCGGHKQYFDRYFGVLADDFQRLLALFRRMNLRQAEITATLYAVWNDFLLGGVPISDDRIIDEVLTNWDESKTRFSREHWQIALNWMRKEGLVPTGFGKATVIPSKKRRP